MRPAGVSVQAASHHRIDDLVVHSSLSHKTTQVSINRAPISTVPRHEKGNIKD
jgi:hypothetical protein